MKSKFTFLVVAGLAVAVSTQAQGYKHNEGYAGKSHITVPPAKFERDQKAAFFERKYNARKMARLHKQELKKERRYARHHRFVKNW